MAEESGACSARWFVDACGGSIVNGYDATVERVETDSRNAGPGVLFVALAGERTDGHGYARKASDAGAGSVLVSSAWWDGQGREAFSGSGAVVIGVPDPLSALQTAALAWRSRFTSLARFGVTGSSGKTTAKELLAAIMAVSNNTVKNPGNLNSDIGLPASIFLIRPAHAVAVFEMGINYPGEMDVLSRIYEPEYALVTNVGTAHIGVLGGSRRAIALEKKKIAERFTGDQILVVWEDDDFREVLMSEIRGRVYTYGPRTTDGFEGARDLGLDGWIIRYHGMEARLHLPGSHNLQNALGAMRIASLYGVSAGDVVRGLESVSPLPGRTAVVHGEYTVIDDCYNANEESVSAALSFCDSLETDARRVYVLGSMKELGAESVAAHTRTGKRAAASRASAILFYGEEMRAAYDSARAVAPQSLISHYERYDDLDAAVSALVKPGDLILLKASRSMELDRLSTRLTGNGGHHVP
jgi:UDP-N-acetylmuramoyl-tripeptide--D-alanyl-D-alanine ligase